MSARAHVLIVDDETFVRDSLSEVLSAADFETSVARGAKEALELLRMRSVDVIITDLKMPAGDGHSLLASALESHATIPIIVITGVGSVADAVLAMKAGAYDFLQKPVDPDELVLLTQRAAGHRELLSEVRQLRDVVALLRGSRAIVGSSPAMTRVRAAIAQVAPTDVTVLITGESGTGKDLAAEEIHRASARSRRALLRVHCAAIDEESFERELFGGRDAIEDRIGKFPQAEGGTLVLDEIGGLHPGVQAQLLRVLETGVHQAAGEARARRADVRVIAITNEDLREQVKRGSFRSDLYYRLNIFPIEMPPLRMHLEDIGEICENWLSRARSAHPGASAKSTDSKLGAQALEVLGSYGWPGNVRELRNVLERAVIVAGSGNLDAPLFRSILETAVAPLPASGPPEFHLRKNLDAAEREIVLGALAHTQGKKKEASLLLGIDPRNLGYYLRKHHIVETSSRET